MRGLKKGALVVLRSGGPEMVIERIDRHYGSVDRYAQCKWFDKLRLRSEKFAVHVLELCCEAPDAEADDDEPADDRRIDRARLPAIAPDDEEDAPVEDDLEDDDESYEDDGEDVEEDEAQSEDDGDGAIAEVSDFHRAIMAARRRVAEAELRSD